MHHQYVFGMGLFLSTNDLFQDFVYILERIKHLFSKLLNLKFFDTC